MASTKYVSKEMSSLDGATDRARRAKSIPQTPASITYRKIIQGDTTTSPITPATTPNVSTKASNQIETPTSNIQSIYDKYIQQLNQQKLSAKNEAYLSSERSKNYVNNLLKSQGLGNSGMTESSQLGVANQYQKALAQANAQYGSGVESAELQKQSGQANYEASLLNAIGSSISQGTMSSEEIDNIVGQYKGALSAENQQLLDIYANAAKSGQTSSLTPVEQSAAITEAKAQGYTSADDISNYIKDKYGISNTEIENIKNVISQSTESIENWKSIIETAQNQEGLKWHNINVPGSVRNISNSLPRIDQNEASDVYINEFMTLAKNNKIPNGTIVDMNYEGGEDYFVYFDGKFYNLNRDAATAKGNIKTLEELKNIKTLEE
jgi:hypothetical protein